MRLALGNPGPKRFWPYGPMAWLYWPAEPAGQHRIDAAGLGGGGHREARGVGGVA